jgi:exonuclease III
MRVMSYNVNGFKGNKDSLINMQLINMHENLNKIEAFIKDFLLGDIDNLVILQEVPLKDNAICYKKIIEKFKDYKFICSYNVSVANFITVAIANNKSKWVEKHDFYNRRESNDYLNRFIEVCNEEYKLQVLGLHIPCNEKDTEEIKKFWNEIINYKKLLIFHLCWWVI